MQAKSIDRASNQNGFYVEHQRFAAWVYMLAVAILGICTGAVIMALRREGSDATTPIEMVFTVALYLLVFDILSLRTVVDGEAIRVQLGRPIPIFWKRIGIDSIRAARVVTYRPIADAGGWGLRFGRFDGVFTIYWNARGNRGVLIETEKRRYIIGSQDPEALHAAIERARGT
ncbi:MAG: hypothetical protein IT366_10335 [Candidatus Hydrogenedentes bacterium]|nr:hypothetical protein [Candidatus Hydrogenedentota bacterium]